MKEFAPLLWIFVVIGAWVFSAVKKAMKESGQAPSKHMPEAWPTAPVIPRHEEQTAQTEEIPQKTLKRRIADDQEPQPAQSLSYELNEYKKHMQIRSKPRTTIKAVATDDNESQISGEGATDTANNIAENFDLRKAVIYSEILKPKFEE